MDTIQQLLEELIDAETFESVRIEGYRRILSFPENLLSGSARAEVNEALQWSIIRLAYIVNAIADIRILIDHGYPLRVQQIAPLGVIEELIGELITIQLAVDEFETAPVGTLDVSDEIAVS